MSCPKKIMIGDSLVFSLCTHNLGTGVLTDADSNPTYRIYENENPDALLTGNMERVDIAHTTGFYTEMVACTLENGFNYDRTYTIYIEAVIGGNTGGVVFVFRIPKIFDFVGVKRQGVSPLEVDFQILD